VSYVITHHPWPEEKRIPDNSRSASETERSEAEVGYPSLQGRRVKSFCCCMKNNITDISLALRLPCFLTPVNLHIAIFNPTGANTVLHIW
jgi:hypothetical protein